MPEDRRQLGGVEPLTQRIVGQPFAVLLLDEFEKCHPKVHDRFLQLTDEGSFLNGAGESVSCGSMIMIATSNAGAEIYRSPAIGFLPPTRDCRVCPAQVAAILAEARVPPPPLRTPLDGHPPAAGG